jgi:hypothetical protein
VFMAKREVVEWSWDLRRLQRVDHPWETNTWISSGFDEPGAQSIRGRTFRRAQRQASAGTVEWLGRLHRSHKPARGPYSICMHREDATTVSYTEIRVSGASLTMRYLPTAPCCARHSRFHVLQLSREPGISRLEESEPLGPANLGRNRYLRLAR